ncbi:hypothetical protein IQ236_05015 [Planktothrix mougeotii LEGE 06226]|uniref:Secreted protein n=2 Tax=Microcoleaceae TaxID=1892252 RepID=A0ABR9U812_9CYAN|nr:hypothetical protein [Planktothrix sp. FACHB-1365]MBE9142583.1 hypothetical protein [Planktothrix mougeotii LEGE 06226]
MLHKSLLILTVTLLSMITSTPAKASEFIPSSFSVESPCPILNTTSQQQLLPSLCPQAREEGQEIIQDTGRPPRD